MNPPDGARSRRAFLQQSALLGAGAVVAPTALSAAQIARVDEQPPAPLPALSAVAAARNEPFWRQVRALYDPDPSLLDFDHGNSGAVPARVIDAYVRRARQLNRAPNVHYPKLSSGDDMYDRIAAWLGAKSPDVALVPNATTGLNTILHGFPLRRGDVVLVTNHEYPDMVETIRRRAQREDFTVRTVALPGRDGTPGDVVANIRAAITPETRLLLVSHVSAWNGEVLPVSEICAVARAAGVATLVDVAQSLGYLPVDFGAWNCDFIAGSFHKGTGAPLGTGVLIVPPRWVGKVEPLHPPTWDISKYPIEQYSWTGTTDVAASATIADAMDAQSRIGLARKRARLMYLNDYWLSRARDIKGFRVLTPTHPDRRMGFCSFALDHVPSEHVAERMRKEFRIEVQDKASRPYRPFDNAVRVSPQPYTTLPELDRFVRALRIIAEG